MRAAGHRKRPKLPGWHYWTYWAGLVCALVAGLSAFGVISWHSKHNSLASRSSEIAAGAQHRVFGSSGGADLPQRRLYPYSVIPGGVESAQELRNAIAHDPLVAEHYANFDLSRAHIVRLTHDREVYVSYRLGDRIFWTKKRLLLRAGETVISDGKHEARTRCGNRISEKPVQPVSPQNEPSNAAMNTPPTSGLFADNTGAPPLLPFSPSSVDPIGPGLPSMPQPPSSPPITVIPPPYFPIVGGGPPSFPGVTPPPPPTPIATPEPGALSLLLLGLLVLGAGAGLSNLRKYFRI